MRSRARAAYAAEIVRERHRHRYEVNPGKIALLEQHGMVITGTNPDSQLVEMIEIQDHPWFVATQAHPEFRSRPVAAHPLFRAFITAALRHVGAAVTGAESCCEDDTAHAPSGA